METGTDGGSVLTGNDKEMDSLLSYLLRDESLFDDLNNLALPLPPSHLHWEPMDLPLDLPTTDTQFEWNETTQESEQNQTTDELEQNEIVSSVLHDHTYCKREGAESQANLRCDNEENSSDGGN